MKKKLLSFALCLTMVATSFTAFPIATNAAEVDSALNENTITETQDANITGDENIENTNDDANIVNDNEQLTEPVDADDNSLTEEQQTNVDKKDINVETDGNDVTVHQENNNEQEPSDVHEEQETVNFTDAGPFMDPVFVGQMKARMFSAERPVDPDGDGNGLALIKNSVKQPDGSYKITMESYTTGKVSSSEKSVPVDVTLVLDQSGSMNFNFNGADDNSQERQKAMKVAVNNFIDSVAAKYDENTADHRISLVEFRGGAEIISEGWKKANEEGKNALKNKVSGLNAKGATNVGAGMQKAEKLMGTDYNYTGKNTERQKVVIVFTDGVPTTTDKFDIEVADAAIKAAKNLKADGCTVYSVGIFNGADPAQTYGDKGFKHNSDGSEGSVWYDKEGWLTGGLGAVDVPAGNRFLNYMSSNFKKADKIGIKEYEEWGLFYSNVGWKIEKNQTRTDTGYYLSANNAADLDKIFQTIVENIQTANIDLDATTVLKDMVTQYFDMPAKTSDIKVYTSDYNGSSFGERVPATGVNVKMSGNTVSVTGFDYNKNFISDKAKDDGTFGKKLIVEFSVTAKDKFLGGNRVPTNEDTSGIYDNKGNSVEAFKVPRVDVPLKSYEAVAKDINIYLNGEVTRADIEGNSGTKFFTNREFIELLDWQTDYVDIKETATGLVSNAKGDSTYEITGQLVPKLYGEVMEGPVVKATGKINVFKPEVTFKDVNGTYGDTFPDLTKAEVSTAWKHGNTLSTDVRMTKQKPELNFEYSYNNDLKLGNYINTPNDIPVNVVTKIKEENINDYTTYKHKACVPACDYIPAEDGEFLVHVKTCTLDVSKVVTGGNNDGQKFVMDITGNTNLGNMKLQVTVDGDGKTVINGLPVGTYNVKENGKWAWRYDVSYNPGTATLSQDNTVGRLVVKNNKTKGKWLNAFAAAENMFGDLGGTVERLLDK